MEDLSFLQSCNLFSNIFELEERTFCFNMLRDVLLIQDVVCEHSHFTDFGDFAERLLRTSWMYSIFH